MSDLSKIRQDVFDSAIYHVVHEGWSWRALNAAAVDVGIDLTTLRRAFPKGPHDLVDYFGQLANKLMVDELASFDLSSVPVRERVSIAVRIHIQQGEAHKKALRRLFSYLILPNNILLSVKFTYSIVDAIWYAVGDDSTDFNFYTKRSLLAGVYISTVLYWFVDESPESDETWAFLDRRISDVMRIPKMSSGLIKGGSRIWSKLMMIRVER